MSEIKYKMHFACGAMHDLKKLPSMKRMMVWGRFNGVQTESPKAKNGNLICCLMCPAKRKDSKMKIQDYITNDKDGKQTVVKGITCEWTSLEEIKEDEK